MVVVGADILTTVRVDEDGKDREKNLERNWDVRSPV